MLKLKFFAVLFVLFFCCSCKTITITADIKNPDYKIYKINKQNQRLYHGYIKAQHLVNLSFENEGTIVYFPFSTGQFVKKGQIIARLDGVLYKIQKQEELAKLKEAQIRKNRYEKYYSRVDTLHRAGAVSDNDWEEAYFNLKTVLQDISIQKQKINYIERQISNNTISAPFNCYISEKFASLGSKVAPFQNVVSIISNDKTEVDVFVDSSFVNNLKPAQKVTVIKDNDKMQGKIAYISKTSLNSGGYLIRIFLDNPSLNLLEGMSVEVSFDKETNAVLIPFEYIKKDNDGRYFVYFVKYLQNNKIQINKRYIKINNIAQSLIEVQEGLKEGDFIINFYNSRDIKEGEILKL